MLGYAGFMGSLQGLVSETFKDSFFGIEDQATRIVITYDISELVETKAKKSVISMRRLHEEAGKLVQGLNVNTLFGLIQFSSYDFFEIILLQVRLEIRKLELVGGRISDGWKIRKSLDSQSS